MGPARTLPLVTGRLAAHAGVVTEQTGAEVRATAANAARQARAGARRAERPIGADRHPGYPQPARERRARARRGGRRVPGGAAYRSTRLTVERGRDQSAAGSASTRPTPCGPGQRRRKSSLVISAWASGSG